MFQFATYILFCANWKDLLFSVICDKPYGSCQASWCLYSFWTCWVPNSTSWCPQSGVDMILLRRFHFKKNLIFLSYPPFAWGPLLAISWEEAERCVCLIYVFMYALCLFFYKVWQSFPSAHTPLSCWSLWEGGGPWGHPPLWIVKFVVVVFFLFQFWHFPPDVSNLFKKIIWGMFT